MVNISIDVTDLGGEARPGDKVIFWRPRVGGSATHAGRVISTAPVDVFLTNGKATVPDVEPGSMRVLLQCRGVESQGPIDVTVPDGTGTVTLRSLIESQFTYAPPIVSAVQEAAANASASERAAIEAQVRSEAAADRADAKVDDAINNGANLVRAEVKQDADRAVSARQAATQSETNAKASENAAATSESNAAASESAAKQSETNAGDYAAVATTAATEAVDAMEAASTSESNAKDSETAVLNAVSRIDALEAMAGLAPESPVDGQTANLVLQPDTLTRRALREDFSPRLGIAASPAPGLKSFQDSNRPLAVGRAAGYLVGYRAGRLYQSDNGETWEDVAPSPEASGPQIVLPCEDGEVLVAQYSGLYRSAGWGTGSVTWVKKHTTNGGSNLQPFSVNGRNGKFILADYGHYDDSRYAHISVDDGKTWTRVWDSDVQVPVVSGVGTHIHGVEYDHYADRFYLSEGHREAAGIWVSEDDGATWVRPPGLSTLDPSPTTLTATKDGLVCGSDSRQAGLFGVPRQADPMDEKFVWTWKWSIGIDGVLGFGVSAHLDPDTGVVYVAFRNGQAGIAPIIAGGTATAGGLVYEWDKSVATPALVDDFKHAIPYKGRLYAHGLVAGDTWHIVGDLAAPGVPAPQQPVTMNGTSVRVGDLSDTTGLRSTAVGVTATSGLDGVAVGHGATASGQSVAVGKDAAPGANAVALGRASATSNGGYETAVGTESKTTGGNATALGGRSSAAVFGTAVGERSTSSSYGTAVGRSANASSNGTAVGYGAAVTGGGDAFGKDATAAARGLALGSGTAAVADSVVAGRGATATGNFSVSVGTSATTTTTATALGAGASAGGDAVAVGRSATSGSSSVAIGANAATARGGNELAIGRNATTTGGNSIAIGGTSTAAALSVAIGHGSGASSYGTAVGRGANAGSSRTAIGDSAKATTANSVALGVGTETTEAHAVAVGPRGVHMQPVTTAPAAPANGAILYVREVSGAMSLCCRIAGGAEIVIAPNAG